MPVIPITSRSDPRFADSPGTGPGMPSETNLLMALAEMNLLGRFNIGQPTQAQNFKRTMDETKTMVDFNNESKRSSYSLLHGNPTGLGKVSE